MKKTKILINSLKGRGVYADEDIKKNEEIELCQLIVLDMKEVGNTLEGYVFGLSSTKVALALGNGSLYNHSDKPNAICYIDTRKKLLSFEARRAIKKGEEITINYGYTRSDRKKFKLV